MGVGIRRKYTGLCTVWGRHGFGGYGKRVQWEGTREGKGKIGYFWVEDAEKCGAVVG